VPGLLRGSVGVCFSGGGSRALTCALGQMMGLRQLRDTGGKPLLDRVRYISSVSGGSWASVLYTFLPEKIADEQFFVPTFPPEDLYLETSSEGGMDVSLMGAHALGSVPQRFANLCDPDPFRNIIAEFLLIVVLRRLGLLEFADFPCYKNFSKIHQTAAETNALAQMWAWCVADEDSPLSTAIVDLF